MNFSIEKLKYFLELAIEEAQQAMKNDNYPIGSIIVNDIGDVLVSGQNENTTLNDITAHAEIQCMRKLGLKKLSKNLGQNNYLITSMEPCLGCGFFIARTNIKQVIWAADDSYKPGLRIGHDLPLISPSFEKLEFISELFEELKIKSKHLMYKYLMKKGRVELAKYYS